MAGRLAAYRPATIKNLSARARLAAMAAAIVTAVVLTGVLGRVHRGGPPESGLAGCTALSSTLHLAVGGYPKIRARFAGSRWPDLRTVGTAYIDLAMRLRHARYADGYETVSFYQRLSAACAKHGRPLNAGP